MVIRNPVGSRIGNELSPARSPQSLGENRCGGCRPSSSHPKDRLLRFSAELVFAICEMKDIEVVIINQGEDLTFEEELAQDVLEIITVFSTRLYGRRSHNKKMLEKLKGRWNRDAYHPGAFQESPPR